MTGRRWAALVLAAAAGGVVAAFMVDMDRAYRRVARGSAAVETRFGDVEYAAGGAGRDVLVVHGSGGGFDQGEILARALLGDSVRWIAPSRFGYLGSELPDGATWDDQADAFAMLLDSLGLSAVDVVAFSQGGPSALLLAVRHPERVRSLTLVSCGVAAQTAGAQAQASRQGDALVSALRYDSIYWALSRLGRRKLLALMGASDHVVASLTPSQHTLVDRVLVSMNPVAPRADGIALDNRAALPGARVAAVQAPTLVLHATDDTLQLFGNAEFAAAAIPDARLVRFGRGGHLLFAVEQAAVQREIEQFLAAHPG